jgi:folate-binding protein YgfZ
VRHSGDPAAELQAALSNFVLADRSNLTRLRATGPDYLDLLHRLSTGDVAALAAGQGRPTILTTPKGRIVERLFVHHLGDAGVLSVGGAGVGPRVLEHLARFTFAENTGLTEVTDETFQFTLVGPRAARALESAKLERPDPFQSRAGSLGGTEVDLLGQDGYSSEGFSIVGPLESAGAVWEALLPVIERHDGRLAGDEALEARRVLCGIPAPGHELTEEHNPLEANQREAVSFDKGCYVGQEVVARLNTYEKVSRALVGLELPAGAALPTTPTRLFDDTQRVGDLTSVVLSPGRDTPIGLGFVKHTALRADLELQVGEGTDVVARIVELPFR